MRFAPYIDPNQHCLLGDCYDFFILCVTLHFGYLFIVDSPTFLGSEKLFYFEVSFLSPAFRFLLTFVFYRKLYFHPNTPVCDFENSHNYENSENLRQFSEFIIVDGDLFFNPPFY